MAIERGSFKNRGPNYSDKGVSMRCARKDETTQTVTLHYLNNGELYDSSLSRRGQW
jgi:DNA-directed RNA polymerase I subunit RPA2